ncbi:cytochrome c-type biogenesis protein CcmH [Parvularcula flava]|uniref:Cytochrome c-type biogenesis protein n=1 Tax=Aquisalinus luteolus TaxID=1566827 RepID=A0A8J3A3H0_9PROT|nr:cytochrome c-type biogenesis protein [Aquisalinus luteolus]NHK29121.1 cytochrome c-type biogenesis protein CcmH [Aquisalinus luteolus]GGI00242.1 cytochrome c-type biogenesis protein CcmH [Aquisalinus luteolus]
MTRLACILVLALSLLPLKAAEPAEALDDPAQEERARVLSQQLRCVVCQNQSIDESDAPLARDLRLLVRERIEAGDTNDEVLDYVVARYGEFVLLRPRFEGEGIILWLTPFLLLIIGAGLVFYYTRQEAVPAGSPAPLSKEELADLYRVLNERPVSLDQVKAVRVDPEHAERRTRGQD